MIAVPPLENQFVRLEPLRLEHAEPLRAGPGPRGRHARPRALADAAPAARSRSRSCAKGRQAPPTGSHAVHESRMVVKQE
jgi:hypothetical protein